MSAVDQPGVRYAVTLGPADVGGRVVVRRRLGEGGLGDLLGRLDRGDDVAVEVVDRHGTRHLVPRDDVVAGKRVPPALPRRG